MPFARTGFFGFRNRANSGERFDRLRFWRKLRVVAAQLSFLDDLLAAYYCALDRDTPLHVKAALVGALAYFVLPFDAIPDMLPVLGFSDDAAVLAAAVRLFAGHIRPAHREAAGLAIERLKAKWRERGDGAVNSSG